MKLNFDLVKKHPVAITAVIVVGGLVLWYLFLGGRSSGSSGAVTTQTSSSDDAMAIAQLQSNTQLTGAAMQYGYESHVADEQYQLGLATLGTQLQSLEVQANSSDYTTKLAAQTAIAQAQISSTTQLGLAQISSSTQLGLGDQQLQAFQSMTQANVDMAKIYAKAASSSSSNSMWGSIAVAAIMAFA